MLMDEKKLLKKIGDLIDQKFDDKFDQKLEPIKQDLNGVRTVQQTISHEIKSIKEQLNTVEMKVEPVNTKVDKVYENLSRKIEASQVDTIDTLSELIHEGYNQHEKRIKRIENHLSLPTSQ